MANRWEFDASAHRFRDTKSGRFLSTSDALGLRDGVLTKRQTDVEDLARQLADETLTVQAWETAMRDLIRDTFASEYVYGRGGLNAMTADDWQTINTLADAQAEYLRAFAQDVAAGKLSEAQIGARSDLYLESSRQAYEHGRAASWGVQVPHVPGDGSTSCKARCKCSLSYADQSDEVHVTWVLHADESCADCRNRAASWNPLVIAKVDDGRVTRLFRAVA